MELFYEGNAETLKEEHAEAMRQDLIRRQAEWKQEAEAWEAISEDSGKTWQEVKTNIDVWARQVYYFDGERIIGPGGG